MHRHRFTAAFILATALLAPAVAQAAATVQVKFYDRTNKDYHVWDTREDQAYRQHLTEQHRKYKPFSKQTHKQQDTYWQWRHTNGR